MNSDIQFLQLLEDDLLAAAEAEMAAEVDGELHAEEAAAAGGGRAGSTPRRLPRRGRNWGGVAAAVVILLVLAGGVGFLTQNRNSAEPAAAPGHNLALTAPSATSDQGVAPAPGTRVEAPALGGFQASTGDTSFGSKSDGSTALPNQAAVSVPQSDLSKIERDGQIGIEVPNGAFTKNVASVTRIAVSNGGMVLSASTQNEKTGTFTLRIPAKHFDVAMLRLRALGVSPSQILYQDVTGQDVTAQFVNLQAQLSIAQGTKARLESLQANATGVGEILSLGSQIDRVELGIEQLQGQIKYINDQVAESTIKVEIREKDAPATQNGTDVSRPSLGSAWSRSLQGFLRVIGAVIVGLGYLIPLGILALAVWGVVMLVRRRDRAAS